MSYFELLAILILSLAVLYFGLGLVCEYVDVDVYACYVHVCVYIYE